MKAPEKYRITTGKLKSEEADGNNGAFLIPKPHDRTLFFSVICSDQLGWEHVSVSLLSKPKRYFHSVHRCPTWDEMCFIKDMFWDEDEAVMQLHPAKKDYVNNHPYVLHLWKPTTGEKIPTPNSLFV